MDGEFVRILQACFVASPCFCGTVADFWLTGGAGDPVLQEQGCIWMASGTK